MRYLRHSSRQLSLAAQAVGCGRADLADRAARGEELRKEGLDTIKGLRGELSKLVVSSSSSDDELLQRRVLWVRRDERATHDFEFLGSIASGLIAAAAAAGGSDGSEGTKPVIVVTSCLPGKDQTHLVLVQSNDQERAKQVNEQIKLGLDSLAAPAPAAGGGDSGGQGGGVGAGKRVKGGGARGRYMSKVDGKWGKAEDAKMAEIIQTVGRFPTQREKSLQEVGLTLTRSIAAQRLIIHPSIQHCGLINEHTRASGASGMTVVAEQM